MGKSVVRESRRDVEDIARSQIFVNNRLERIHMQQRRMRAELTHRQLVAHAPAAAAHPLNDKHVVLIDMRTHAAAGHGEGDHQIVQTPVRQNAERTHQLRGGHMPVVHRLRQQRPAGFAQIVEVLKRAIAGLPFTVEMAHQTAIDLRLHRQPCQLVRGNRIDKIREGIFQHNGLFLPVFLKKFRPVQVQLIRHG